MDSSKQSGAISRKLVIWISIPVILVGLCVGLSSMVRFKQERERAAWKTVALSQIAEFSVEEISEELEALKATRNMEDREEWVGRQVILMANNEYLVYGFRHGFNNGFIDHLFLARGSDGRWYYSTYHFCNNLVMLMSDDPPDSIAEFTSSYAAREFDGKSDECLQHTWP